jgi:hypothetical protein
MYLYTNSMSTHSDRRIRGPASDLSIHRCASRCRRTSVPGIVAANSESVDRFVPKTYSLHIHINAANSSSVPNFFKIPAQTVSGWVAEVSFMMERKGSQNCVGGRNSSCRPHSRPFLKGME